MGMWQKTVRNIALVLASGIMTHFTFHIELSFSPFYSSLLTLAVSVTVTSVMLYCFTSLNIVYSGKQSHKHLFLHSPLRPMY